jgi:hypothetical protein
LEYFHLVEWLLIRRRPGSLHDADPDRYGKNERTKFNSQITEQQRHYHAAQDWVQYGADIPVTFANGDQLGARAKPDGTVEIYRNGALLATRSITSWPYYANGGYIGLWFVNAPGALIDDFGGGTR